MSTATAFECLPLSVPAPVSSSPLQDGPTAFAAVRDALAAHLADPASTEKWAGLLFTRRVAAGIIAEIPRRDQLGLLTAEAKGLVTEIVQSGVLDAVAENADVAFAQGALSRGWPGILAAMLLLPAWQWPAAPAMDAVPDWLWSDYATWLFSRPQEFSACGQVKPFADHILKRLEELNHWIARNRGSAAVQAAVRACLNSTFTVQLYFYEGNLRPHAERYGRMLHSTLRLPNLDFDRVPIPREARKLRVGFINRHFSPQTETYTTLPTFEHLDPDRFEVVLFAFHEGDTPLEKHCRKRANEFYVLPRDIQGQLSTLGSSGLDVAVFGTNLTGAYNEVVQLALYRFAPLQVVNNSSCISTGLPEVDLYVSGSLTELPDASAQFTERLGLLPGPAHAFNYQADQQAPTGNWTRAALNIPEDATLFVSAANYFKIIPEMQHTWAKLLAATPNSYLLVHPFNPNWSSRYPIERFCAEFDRVLARYGVEKSRLVVSSSKFPSRADVKELLKVGDVYLDSFPFGGVNSLIDPLENGTPVVVWEGQTFRSRMGAALLRSLGLDELIAANECDYHAITTKLALDSEYRREISEKIRAKMDHVPIFMDTLAAGDAFGALLETAFDELVSIGRPAFRSKKEAVVATAPTLPAESLAAGLKAIEVGNFPAAATHARSILRTDPVNLSARHLLGRAYVAAGNPSRAVDYLLAAVQSATEGNARLWFDLATALQENGQTKEAVQALGASLELDKANLDGWLMMTRLADAASAPDLAHEALQVARNLAPDDPRVEGLIAHLGDLSSSV